MSMFSRNLFRSRVVCRRLMRDFRRRVATATEKSEKPKISARIFIPIGAFAGAMGAFCGLGGAMVLVPTLTTFSNFAPHMVAGTSVCCNTMNASVGAVSYLKQGFVDIPAAVCLSVAGAAAAAIGARLSGRLSGPLLKRITGCFLLASVPSTLQKRKAGTASVVDAKPSQQFSIGTHWPYMVAGSGGGFLSGLIGVGSGVIMMSYMSSNLCNIEQHAAVATSLAATVPMGLVSTSMHFSRGNVNVPAVALICGVSAVSMAAASMYALKVDEKKLRYFFATLVAVMSAQMIIKS